MKKISNLIFYAFVIFIIVYTAIYFLGDLFTITPNTIKVVPEIYSDEGLFFTSKTSDKYFEIYDDEKWNKFFIKGANIGSSTPGRWFTEFLADRDMYRQWLEDIGNMNLNTIRLYTLMDPSFYQVFKEYNEDPNTPTLRLIQEIWPDDFVPECNFHNEKYKSNYKSEVQNVIDALHGNLEQLGRKNRAYGNYTADVSPYVLGVLIGREFEPEEVESTNAKGSENIKYLGDYVRIDQGTPTEVWLAELCDFTSAYITNEYSWQYPVGFVSWPTLDPLTHPTERESEEISAIPAYNDREVINPDRFYRGDSNITGFFGAYHIYPNYPDFMNNEPGFSEQSDDQGSFKYLGYLNDFIDIHPNYPAIVAEYGISTSLNTAHLNPDGLHHGGISEELQGPFIIRMTDSIINEGYAGSIIFEWLDEWAKKTWNTEPYISPWDRNVLWKNAMDPEQNYGIIAVEPDHIPFSGKSYVKSEYEQVDDLDTGVITQFEKDADESFLYLSVTLNQFPKDTNGDILWVNFNLVVGIDTIEEEKGEFLLPIKDSPKLSTGVEFIVKLNSTNNAKVQVIPPYNRSEYSYHSKVLNQGFFEDIQAVVNRKRVTLDGRTFPELISNQSILNYGNFNSDSNEFNSLSHWYVDYENNKIIMRLPWMLLGVTDPSSAMVAYDERDFLKDPDSANYVLAFEKCAEEMPAYSLEAAEQIEDWKRLETKETSGFNFYIATYTDRVIDFKPKSENSFSSSEKYLWELWEEPSYKYRYKKSYDILKNYFDQIDIIKD